MDLNNTTDWGCWACSPQNLSPTVQEGVVGTIKSLSQPLLWWFQGQETQREATRRWDRLLLIWCLILWVLLYSISRKVHRRLELKWMEQKRPKTPTGCPGTFLGCL
jgi:hypothetical protein